MTHGVPAMSDGVPTLAFDDLAAAVAYYRDIFGFDIAGGDSECYARLHGGTLRLRAARPGELAGRVSSWERVDATLLVDRPYRLYRHLDDRGPGCDTLNGFEPGNDGFRRVMDPFANVIAIGRKPGLVPSLKRAAWPPLTDRICVNWRTLRNDLREWPHQREFRAFYQALPDKRDIFYMFFLGGGLLHWVAKAASYVPADVNLVLIGSAVPEPERDWVRAVTGRPFFHLDLPVDDKTMWKFLLHHNEFNFGWLDIDCLVLKSELFAEMRAIAPDTSVNGCWWYDSGFGFPLAATYFQFVNIEAERALRADGLRVDPTLYSYRPFNILVPGARYYTRVLPRRFRQRLSLIVPTDDRGRPYLPGPTHPDAGNVLYYDTTVVHQMLARTIGFLGSQVRRLRRRGLGGTGGAYEELSDELVHIGGVSYGNRVSQVSSATETKLRYLLADHVALLDAGDRLPDAYVERQHSVTARLRGYGLDPRAATEAARRHLIDERGLSENAAEAVLRPPVPAAPHR